MCCCWVVFVGISIVTAFFVSCLLIDLIVLLLVVVFFVFFLLIVLLGLVGMAGVGSVGVVEPGGLVVVDVSVSTGGWVGGHAVASVH